MHQRNRGVSLGQRSPEIDLLLLLERKTHLFLFPPFPSTCAYRFLVTNHTCYTLASGPPGCLDNPSFSILPQPSCLFRSHLLCSAVCAIKDLQCVCVCVNLEGALLEQFASPGMSSIPEKQAAGHLGLFLQQNSGKCDQIRVHLLFRFSAAIRQKNFLFYFFVLYFWC